MEEPVPITLLVPEHEQRTGEFTQFERGRRKEKDPRSS